MNRFSLTADFDELHAKALEIAKEQGCENDPEPELAEGMTPARRATVRQFFACWEAAMPAEPPTEALWIDE